jgi:hypothetical protein
MTESTNRTCALQRAGLSALARLVLAVGASLLSQAGVAQGDRSLLLQSTEVRVHRLPAGQAAGEIRFAVDAGTTRLSLEVVSPLSGLVQSVTTPSGAVLTPQTAAALGGLYLHVPQSSVVTGAFPLGSTTATVYRWSIPIAQAGWATLRFANPAAVTADTPVVVQAVSDSPIRIAAIPVAANRRPGQPVALAVAVISGSQALAGASVRADVVAGGKAETSLTLRDDGSGADAVAGDGIYSALYVPPTDGLRTVGYTVNIAATGILLTRQANSEFDATAPSATLSNLGQWQTLDTNGDGRTDQLRWAGQVDVTKPGRYLVSALLRSGDRWMHANAEYKWDAGVAPASITIPSTRLETEGVGPGRYVVESLSLMRYFGPDLPLTSEAASGSYRLTQRLASGAVIDLTNTEFDRPRLRLTGQSTFVGSGPNQSGLWEFLAFELEIESIRAEVYTASAVLYSGSRRITSCRAQQAQPAGVSRIRMLCTGRDIGSQRIDGPYTAKGLWIYGRSAGPGTLTLAVPGPFAVSGPLRAADFAGSNRRPEDVDGDGHVTCSDEGWVRVAIGLRSGDAAWDARNDVDGDGVVTLADVARVLAALPAGRVCEPL